MNFHDIALTVSKDVKANSNRKQIAGALELEPYEIQEIEDKSKTNYDFYTHVFLTWRSTFGSNATQEKLIQALRSLKLTEVADELSKSNEQKSKSEPKPDEPQSKSKSNSTETLAQYVFKEAFATIRKNLATDSILSELFSKNVISMQEREDIKDLKDYTNRTMLINIMMRKDKKSVHAFIAAVKSETAGQEPIWEELEKHVLDFEETMKP